MCRSNQPAQVRTDFDWLVYNINGCNWFGHLSDQCCAFCSVLVKMEKEMFSVQLLDTYTTTKWIHYSLYGHELNRGRLIESLARQLMSPYHHIDGLLFNPVNGSFSGGVGGSCSTKTRRMGQEETRIPINTHGCRGSPPQQNRYDRNVGYTTNMHKCVEKQKQSWALQQRCTMRHSRTTRYSSSV